MLCCVSAGLAIIPVDLAPLLRSIWSAGRGNLVTAIVDKGLGCESVGFFLWDPPFKTKTSGLFLDSLQKPPWYPEGRDTLQSLPLPQLPGQRLQGTQRQNSKKPPAAHFRPSGRPWRATKIDCGSNETMRIVVPIEGILESAGMECLEKSPNSKGSHGVLHGFPWVLVNRRCSKLVDW